MEGRRRCRPCVNLGIVPNTDARRPPRGEERDEIAFPLAKFIFVTVLLRKTNCMNATGNKEWSRRKTQWFSGTLSEMFW